MKQKILKLFPLNCRIVWGNFDSVKGCDLSASREAVISDCGILWLSSCPFMTWQCPESSCLCHCHLIQSTSIKASGNDYKHFRNQKQLKRLLRVSTCTHWLATHPPPSNDPLRFTHTEKCCWYHFPVIFSTGFLCIPLHPTQHPPPPPTHTACPTEIYTHRDFLLMSLPCFLSVGFLHILSWSPNERKNDVPCRFSGGLPSWASS